MVGQKLKNAQNQILLQPKDAPFNGGSAQTPFADGLWRDTQKLRSSSYCSYTVSSSQVSSDTMLDFYQLDSMILGSYLRE